MKNNWKSHSVQPQFISRCVWSALALIAVSQAQANKDFADVPFYLDSKTESSAVSIKPKIMLLIDDSGSMEWVPGANRVPSRVSEVSRLKITKEALSNVVNINKGRVKWGFQTLNNNGNVNLNGYTENSADILSRIRNLTANGGTPTTIRFKETAELMMRQTELRCDKNFIVVMSDGDANGTQKAGRWENDYYGGCYPAGVSPYYANNEIDDQYFGSRSGGRPQYTCRRDRYTGVRSVDLWDTVWDRNDGLGWFSKTLSTKDFKTSGTDLYGKSWDGVAEDPRNPANEKESLYKNQVAETYTVGFGESLSQEGRRYLQEGASDPTNYFDARNGADLIKAFDNIIKNIIESKSGALLISAESPTAPAIPAVGRSDSAAIVEVDNISWSSRLKFNRINYVKDAQGNERAEVDEKNFVEPNFAGRKVMLNDGSKTHWVSDLLQPNNPNNNLNNAYFGINGSNPTDQLEWQKVLLPWTARSQDDTNLNELAKTNRYSQGYRIREAGKRDLGDILDSTLTTIGDAKNGRAEFMVTAANDGMVHLFQSEAGSHPYGLKLSYIPAGMERDDDRGEATTMGKYLKDVASEKYGQSIPHRYMVNGGIVVRRTAESPNTKGQQSFLFGAMGQGGRGAYALNIGGKDRVSGQDIGLNAAQGSWLGQVPLFETVKGADNKLGYTVGTPQIGRISVEREKDKAVAFDKGVRYAGFLASGYRSKTDAAKNETALYVYDMLGQNADSGQVEGTAKGAVIGKISVSNVNGVGGLSSPTLVDVDFDGVIDVAYAGDYGGNMYRFDFRGKPNEWKVSRIFTGDPKKPVTAAPAVSRQRNGKYVVIFGTGSDIYTTDRDNKDQQSIYGIFDDLSQDAADAKDSGSDLLVQTLTEEEVGGQTGYRLTDNKITANHKGWKIDLKNNGERVVVKPTMILRTAVISARSYVVETKTQNAGGADICIPEKTETNTSSSTMLLGVNADTGGLPNRRTGKVQFIKDSGVNQDYAGLRREGIISFTYMDTTKLNDSPVTRDGDSGGSGTDQLFKAANTEIPNNKCFSRNAVRTLLTNKGSDFAVDGRICGIRRLSWREIFF